MRRSRRRGGKPAVGDVSLDGAPSDVDALADDDSAHPSSPAIALLGTGQAGSGMPPAGTLAKGRGRLRAGDGSGVFLFEIGSLRYRVIAGGQESSSPLLNVDVSVNQGEWFSVCRGAGMLFRDPSGAVFTPAQAAERVQVTELKSAIRGKTLSLRYTEQFGDLTLRRTLQLRLVGSTLVLQLAAPGAAPAGPASTGRSRRGRRGGRPLEPAAPAVAAGYGGFSFATVGGTDAREVLIPYTVDPVYLLSNGWFVTAYVDRFLSAANACPRGTAFYRADTLGHVGPISETLYLTAAADPLDTLPLIEATASPYLKELARRVILDVWSEAPFATDQETFARLRRYGLKDLLVHYHTWQEHGFGRRLPGHYPANPDRGTNEEFRQLVQFARDQGWQVALREDYSAISLDSRYWDPSVIARTGDGGLRPARLGGYAIGVDRMLPFARLESTKIERNYSPGAASVGAGAAYNPEDQLHQIDLDASAKSGRTMADALRHCRALFQYLRELHGGPLVAEGGEGPGRFDTYYAGIVDGFERPLDGRASGPVIPDYELRRVQPVMANHGVGYYGRFFNEIHGQAPIDPERVSWDLYRATEIAFAHAGFLSTAQVPAPPLGPWVPMGSMREAFGEYYLMRAVQERLMLTPVHRIEYHHAGEPLDLASALRAGFDLTQAQLQIVYQGGLAAFVNRHSRSEWTIRWGGMSYILPPSGWLVGDEHGLLAYSALIAGNRADFARCVEYIYLNTRSDLARRIEGITTDGAVALVAGAVPGRPDLFVSGCKSVSDRDELLKLSERADLSLEHRSNDEVELCLLDTESGSSVNVTIPYYGPEWEQGRLQLIEQEDTLTATPGEWRRAPNQIQHTKRGLQIARLRPGVLYRLSLPQ
jgi:hypothetical protein